MAIRRVRDDAPPDDGCTDGTSLDQAIRKVVTEESEEPVPDHLVELAEELEKRLDAAHPPDKTGKPAPEKPARDPD